jgi:hypothetical protein
VAGRGAVKVGFLGCGKFLAVAIREQIRNAFPTNCVATVEWVDREGFSVRLDNLTLAEVLQLAETVKRFGA